MTDIILKGRKYGKHFYLVGYDLAPPPIVLYVRVIIATGRDEKSVKQICFLEISVRRFVKT